MIHTINTKVMGLILIQPNKLFLSVCSGNKTGLQNLGSVLRTKCPNTEFLQLILL